MYIWGKRIGEKVIVPEIYGSKQTEYESVGRELGLFTDSHKGYSPEDQYF